MSGSAQNPLTLNRYLYANANPATMIDPDGHRTVRDDDRRGDNSMVYADGCYNGYCPLAIQEEAASQAKIAAGCPVQYCGTARQKATNAWLDLGMQNAIDEYAWHQNNMKIAEQNEAAAEEGRRAALEQQMNAQFAAMNQNCSWNPLDGKSCYSDAIGGIGNTIADPLGTWADTGGGVVNNVAPWVVAGVIGGVVCFGLVVTAAVCAGAAASYFLGVTGKNLLNGERDPTKLLAGADPFDFGVSLASAGIMDKLVSLGSNPVAVGSTGSLAVDWITQQHHGTQSVCEYIASYALGGLSGQLPGNRDSEILTGSITSGLLGGAVSRLVEFLGC